MRSSEFVHEEYFQVKEQAPNESDQIAASLLTVLNFVKSRSEETDVPAKLRTDSLINLVKNTGHPSFCYDDLVAANEGSDTVKNLIKSFNKDEIILATHDDEGYNNDEQDNRPSQNPRDTVDSMAKKAMKARQ